MTLGICKSVSGKFYNRKLRTCKSYDNRWQSKKLFEFITGRDGYALGESFFVISGSSVLKGKVETSMLNPEHASFIGGLEGLFVCFILYTCYLGS